jgi:hypothetical protein
MKKLVDVMSRKVARRFCPDKSLWVEKNVFCTLGEKICPGEISGQNPRLPVRQHEQQ